jgi:CRP/FNR family transcriptional regulator, cyclic AMP receptor protein
MARRTRSEMLEILRGIPLFAHLPKGDLREIAKLCFEEVYETDQVILKQLEDAQFMVAITSGRARVTRDGHAVAEVGAGEVVGEMALIDGQRRSAAVVAETRVEGIVLHRTAFLKLLDSNPSMARWLLMAQTARLREADRNLGALG